MAELLAGGTESRGVAALLAGGLSTVLPLLDNGSYPTNWR